MSLTLDFNLAGSWRKVLVFDEAQLALVAPAARTLLQAAGRGEASFRVVTSDGEVRLIEDKEGRHEWPFRERRA